MDCPFIILLAGFCPRAVSYQEGRLLRATLEVSCYLFTLLSSLWPSEIITCELCSHTRWWRQFPCGQVVNLCNGTLYRNNTTWISWLWKHVSGRNGVSEGGRDIQRQSSGNLTDKVELSNLSLSIIFCKCLALATRQPHLKHRGKPCTTQMPSSYDVLPLCRVNCKLLLAQMQRERERLRIGKIDSEFQRISRIWVRKPGARMQIDPM